jgi:hypothetical protein
VGAPHHQPTNNPQRYQAASEVLRVVPGMHDVDDHEAPAGLHDAERLIDRLHAASGQALPKGPGVPDTTDQPRLH